MRDVDITPARGRLHRLVRRLGFESVMDAGLLLVTMMLSVSVILLGLKIDHLDEKVSRLQRSQPQQEQR